MRLLLFNLVTDVKHPILGFTTQWIRELAAHVESIDVITMCAGEIAVPDNVRVYSTGRERGWSEPRRMVEFYRHLFRVLGERRIDGCFSHMIQVFSVLAAPVLRARGIPLVTWYAHPQLSPTLKLAHFVSNRMVTSLPSAYPYRKDKVSVIGQGIDTTLFAPADRVMADDALILCVGRLSPVKSHATLLRAFARLPPHLRLEIVGATSGAADEAYAAGLGALAMELGVADRVILAPPVPPSELPAYYRRCAVHVNLTPVGSGDKVAWEAMSCGRPCLVANADFRETLGTHADRLLFHGDEDLAAKIATLLQESAASRAAMGLDLRANVVRLHSLPRLAERILEQLHRSFAS
ncbi:MAG: glycosyltransferase family 4 protein [Longimicrobiales bacterium]